MSQVGQVVADEKRSARDGDQRHQLAGFVQRAVAAGQGHIGVELEPLPQVLPPSHVASDRANLVIYICGGRLTLLEVEEHRAGVDADPAAVDKADHGQQRRPAGEQVGVADGLANGGHASPQRRDASERPGVEEVDLEVLEPRLAEAAEGVRQMFEHFGVARVQHVEGAQVLFVRIGHPAPTLGIAQKPLLGRFAAQLRVGRDQERRQPDTGLEAVGRQPPDQPFEVAAELGVRFPVPPGLLPTVVDLDVLEPVATELAVLELGSVGEHVLGADPGAEVIPAQPASRHGRLGSGTHGDPRQSVAHVGSSGQDQLFAFPTLAWLGLPQGRLRSSGVVGLPLHCGQLASVQLELSKYSFGGRRAHGDAGTRIVGCPAVPGRLQGSALFGHTSQAGGIPGPVAVVDEGRRDPVGELQEAAEVAGARAAGQFGVDHRAADALDHAATEQPQAPRKA